MNKRGPKPAGYVEPYKIVGRTKIKGEEVGAIKRRIEPFLQGCGSYTLEHLLGEAYVQGLRDAAEILSPQTPHEGALGE